MKPSREAVVKLLVDTLLAFKKSKPPVQSKETKRKRSAEERIAVKALKAAEAEAVSDRTPVLAVRNGVEWEKGAWTSRDCHCEFPVLGLYSRCEKKCRTTSDVNAEGDPIYRRGCYEHYKLGEDVWRNQRAAKLSTYRLRRRVPLTRLTLTRFRVSPPVRGYVCHCNHG